MSEIKFPNWPQLIATEKFNFKSALISDLPGRPGQLLGKKIMSADRIQFYEFSRESLLLDLQSSADVELWRRAVRAALDAGIRHFILCSMGQPVSQSNSVDGLFVTDHLNLSGQNPLVGPNAEQYGPRFPDVSKMYEREKAVVVIDLAQRHGIQLESGLLLIPQQLPKLTELEQQIITQNKVAAVGGAIFSGAITAAHAGCRSTAIIFYHSPAESPLMAFIRDLLQISTKS